LILSSVLAFAALVTSTANAADAAGTRSARCGEATYGSAGYSYAGLQAGHYGHGIRAALTALAGTAVAKGHVAGWVGVSGPGRGEDRDRAWLQVGFSSSPGSPGNLYYEVKRSGASPAYHLVEAGITRGDLRRLAVLEMNRQPGWWRVWVDGRPVSPPIQLQRTGSRLRPIATAEAWDGGSGACNSFAYRFESVEIAASRGGSWTPFRTGFRFQDRGYRLSLLDPRRQLAGRRPPRRGAAGGVPTSFVAASR
jgi:hypothetical protein